MTTGEKIRSLRKSMKLTQTELGQKLGVKTNAVSKWECGRVYDIPTSKIKAMAQLFEVAPSFLIDDDSATEELMKAAVAQNRMVKDVLESTNGLLSASGCNHIGCSAQFVSRENTEALSEIFLELAQLNANNCADQLQLLRNIAQSITSIGPDGRKALKEYVDFLKAKYGRT